MIDPNEFDATLRQWLKKEIFVPFVVELDDGQKIWIKRPALAPSITAERLIMISVVSGVLPPLRLRCGQFPIFRKVVGRYLNRWASTAAGADSDELSAIPRSHPSG